MATYKDYVRVATTNNITLSGAQTIDGVALVAGERVLVKDQTTPSANGIYLVAAGSWARSADANSSALMTPETTVRVSRGMINAHTEWSLVTQAPITLGTTALTFANCGCRGKATKAMADSDQTLSPSEGSNALLETTGALTARRRLSFPAPGSESDSFQRTVLNACRNNSIVLSVGASHPELEVEPGAKVIAQVTPTGVFPIVDLPLDPRDFGCPWNGVDDDLPGLQAMIACIPPDRNRPTRIQLPKGQGYSSGHWEINRKVDVFGHGKSYAAATSIQNAIKFAPLRGVVVHGYASSPDFSDVPPYGGMADDSRLRDLNVLTTQAVVSDGLGNWGRGAYQLDTTKDTWSELPSPVPLGSCVVRGSSLMPVTVGSSDTEYYGDGHSRDATHLVMFRCTTSGSKGSAVPDDFATADLEDLGTEIIATDGHAKWTVESIPKDYANDTHYFAGQRVLLPGDNDHVFEALDAGTSLPLVSTTITSDSDGHPVVVDAIDVADTSAFPSAGIICIFGSKGREFVKYADKTPKTFTGCTPVPYLKKPSGTMSTGGSVVGPFPWAPWGVPVRCSPSMVSPAYNEEFHDRQTAVDSSMDGLSLPLTTITVNSTMDFAASGTVKIWTGSTYTEVTYTSKTETQFQGCSGGGGTLATGQEVGQGIRWRQIPSAAVTILANWVTIEDSFIAGATGASVWITGNYRKSTPGGSNFWSVRRCIFHASGNGLSLNSDNTNGGESAFIQETFVGAGRTNVDAAAYLNINGGIWADGRFGNAGAAVKDRTLGNNEHRIHYIQFSGGLPFRNDLFTSDTPGGNSTRWDYLGAETELQALVLYPAVVTACVHGVSSESDATLIAGGTDNRNIRAAVPLASDPSKKLISTHGPQSRNVASVFNFYQAGPPERPEETDAYPLGIGITDDQPDYPSKWFTFGKTNNPGFFTEQLFLFPRPHPSGATWPSGEPVGAMMPMWINQSRVWIGAASNLDPPSIGFGATVPVSGYYVRGSVTWNSNPAVGSPIGWVCTETGSPGTWAALARLES